MRPFFSLSLSSSSSSSLAHQKLCHSVKFSNHVFRLIVNSSFEDPSILVQTEFAQIDGRKGGMVCFGNRMDKFGSSIELFLPFSISRSNTPSRKCNRETSSNRLCRYRGDFARVYKYPCVEKGRRERRSGEERQDRGRVLCPWTTGQDVHVETLSPAPRFQRSMLTLERLSSVTRIINYIFQSFIPFLLYISVISANPSRKLPRIFFTWAKKIKKG